MKEGFVQKYALGDEIHHVSNPAREEYHRYFFLEELYNTSLNTFAENVSKTIYGVNTVRGQLGAGPDRGETTSIGFFFLLFIFLNIQTNG